MRRTALALAFVLFATAAVTATATARKSKPPPTYAGCGTAAGETVSDALDIFVAAFERLGSRPPSLGASLARARATRSLDKKRGKALTKALGCIEPLLGADPVPTSASAGSITLRSRGGARGGRTQELASCLATLQGDRAAIEAVYADNLRAIGVDPRFTAFEAATVVLTDMHARYTVALAAFFGCLAGPGVTLPSPETTHPCAADLVASLDSAVEADSVAEAAADASGASADQQAFAQALALAAYDRAVTASTKRFFACAKRSAQGGRGADVVQTVPEPPPPPPPPPPEPQAPTRAECQTIGAQELAELRSILIGTATFFGDGLSDDSGDPVLIHVAALALITEALEQYRAALALRRLCFAIAEATYGPSGSP
jgi:hypothetical protein